MELEQGSGGGEGGEHALPGPLVGTLFASMLGAMVPGIYMTLVAAPGLQGSPVYGLMLPWTMLPFLLAVAAAWMSRKLPEARQVRLWCVVAAVVGAVVYSHYMLIDAKGVRNIRVFLYLPLWQWGMMARAMMRAVLAARRAG